MRSSTSLVNSPACMHGKIIATTRTVKNRSKRSTHHPMLPHCLAGEKDLAQDFSWGEVPNQTHLASHAELAVLCAPNLARDAHRRPVDINTFSRSPCTHTCTASAGLSSTGKCMRQSQVPQGKQKAPEAAKAGLREHHLNNLLYCTAVAFFQLQHRLREKRKNAMASIWGPHRTRILATAVVRNPWHSNMATADSNTPAGHNTCKYRCNAQTNPASYIFDAAKLLIARPIMTLPLGSTIHPHLEPVRSGMTTVSTSSPSSSRTRSFRVPQEETDSLVT